jgi:hypothetical protein
VTLKDGYNAGLAIIDDAKPGITIPKPPPVAAAEAAPVAGAVVAPAAKWAPAEEAGRPVPASWKPGIIVGIPIIPAPGMNPIIGIDIGIIMGIIPGFTAIILGCTPASKQQHIKATAEPPETTLVEREREAHTCCSELLLQH